MAMVSPNSRCLASEFGPGIAMASVYADRKLGAGSRRGRGSAGGGVVAGLAGVGMRGYGCAAAGGVVAGAARGGARFGRRRTAVYRAGGASGVATSALRRGGRVMSPLRSAAGSLKASSKAGGSGPR